MSDPVNHPIYYKAVQPDGTSFHDPRFRWLPEDGVIPEDGWVVSHRLRPAPDALMNHAARYLSVSTVPTDCTGMSWPCRLLEVEPVDGYEVVTPDPGVLPNKRGARAWRVVRELPATDALGPQGVEVAALIDRAERLTGEEISALNAAWTAARNAAWTAARNSAWDAVRNAERDSAWDAERDSAWDAARNAAWTAARNAARNSARNAERDSAWDAAWRVARDATLATLVRDLITDEQYTALAGPWQTMVGGVE